MGGGQFPLSVLLRTATRVCAVRRQRPAKIYVPKCAINLRDVPQSRKNKTRCPSDWSSIRVLYTPTIYRRILFTRASPFWWHDGGTTTATSAALPNAEDWHRVHFCEGAVLTKHARQGNSDCKRASGPALERALPNLYLIVGQLNPTVADRKKTGVLVGLLSAHAGAQQEKTM